jgi:hypothetical protein
MKRLLVFLIIALAASQARADYSANDLASYCAVVHVHNGSYQTGISQGVCVGYIAAYAAIHQDWFGTIDVVRTADEFATFGKKFGTDFPASTALYVMLEKDRNEGERGSKQ